MQDVNVLVTFWSRTGTTERLALAAALGAVQARANIRLRWLREAAEDHAVDAVREWRENRDRMDREYVAPRQADFVWADAMLVAIPARLGTVPPELKTCVDLLRAARRVGIAFTTVLAGEGPGDSILLELHAAMAQLRLTIVPAREDVRMQGHRLAEVARTLRKS